jgi:hypothetical protein
VQNQINLRKAWYWFFPYLVCDCIWCFLTSKFYDREHFLVKRYDRYNSHQSLSGRPWQVYYNIFLCFVGNLLSLCFQGRVTYVLFRITNWAPVCNSGIHIAEHRYLGTGYFFTPPFFSQFFYQHFFSYFLLISSYM